MTRIRITSIAIGVFIIAGLLVLFSNQNTKYQDLLSNYNDLSVEHQRLKEDLERIPDESTPTTTGKVSEGIQAEYSFILRYSGMKYPVTSGLRRYVGEDSLRIYPSSKAPFVYEDWNPDVVELINEVSTQNKEGYHEGNWCLVLDTARGISGYAKSTDLIKIDETDKKYTRDYGSGIETLGGFKVDDRIETLIGLLNRDYYLIYENGRIFEFADNQSKDFIIEPLHRPFSDTHTLDAFVGDTNHISRLRTDSPEFPLKDGYKVGDNAMKVLDYYSAKYKTLDDQGSKFYYSGYTFIQEEGHMLEFFIDTEELNENSVISSISID